MIMYIQCKILASITSQKAVMQALSIIDCSAEFVKANMICAHKTMMISYSIMQYTAR